MTTVTIDDSDPRIMYTGPWFSGGRSATGDYNSTIHGTNNAGAYATFLFNGTGLAVYGMISSSRHNTSAPVSTYVLDEERPVFYTAVQGQSPAFGQLFYESSSLQDGSHSLVITSTVQGSFFLA